MRHQSLGSMPPPPPPGHAGAASQYRGQYYQHSSTSTSKHILLVIKLNHYTATNTANTNVEPEAGFPDENRIRLYLLTGTKVLT